MNNSFRIWLAVVLLALSVRVAGPARSAVVTGSLVDITGASMTNVLVKLTPLSYPQVDSGVVINYAPMTFPVTNTFSWTLEQGDYLFAIGSRQYFQFAVPNDTNTYNIESLITTSVTYIWPITPSTNTPLATVSVSGTVKTDDTEADPVVYLKTTMDTILGWSTNLWTGGEYTNLTALPIPIGQGGSGTTNNTRLLVFDTFNRADWLPASASDYWHLNQRAEVGDQWIARNSDNLNTTNLVLTNGAVHMISWSPYRATYMCQETPQQVGTIASKVYFTDNTENSELEGCVTMAIGNTNIVNWMQDIAHFRLDRATNGYLRCHIDYLQGVDWYGDLALGTVIPAPAYGTEIKFVGDIDSTTGRARLWIDGSLVCSVTNALFQRPALCGRYIYWEPIGAAGGDPGTVPHISEVAAWANSLATTLPVKFGGTFASTASGARSNLGLVIGTDVQAWSPVLDGVAASDHALTNMTLYGELIVRRGADEATYDFPPTNGLAGTVLTEDGSGNLDWKSVAGPLLDADGILQTNILLSTHNITFTDAGTPTAILSPDASGWPGLFETNGTSAWTNATLDPHLLTKGYADQIYWPARSNLSTTVYNVTAFGATGDGVTDDSAAIIRGVKYIAETNTAGGTLYFPTPPGGKYLCNTNVTATLSANKPFQLLGAQGAKLQGRSFANYYFLNITVASGVSITNLTVRGIEFAGADSTDANMPYGGLAITLADATAGIYSTKIDNCTFRYMRGRAFGVDGVGPRVDTFITDCLFQYCCYSTTFVGGSGVIGMSYGLNGLIVENCRWLDCVVNGWTGDPPHAMYIGSVTPGLVSYRFVGNNLYISRSPSDVSDTCDIALCNFRDVQANGLYASNAVNALYLPRCDGVVIQDVFLSGGSTIETHYATNVIISDVVITNVASGKTLAQINILESDNVKIQNCTASIAYTGAYFLNLDTCNDVEVNNNHVEMISSGTIAVVLGTSGNRIFLRENRFMSDTLQSFSAGDGDNVYTYNNFFVTGATLSGTRGIYKPTAATNWIAVGDTMWNTNIAIQPHWAAAVANRDANVSWGRRIVWGTAAQTNWFPSGNLWSSDNLISTNITLGTAGVSLTTDQDGAMTLLGLGNGYDENLTLNLDDVENTAGVSSSGVTNIDFGTIVLTSSNIVATNLLSARSIAIADAATLNGCNLATNGFTATLRIINGFGTTNELVFLNGILQSTNIVY